MTANTRQTILTKSKMLFTLNGYEGFSIRLLSKESGIGISSIYHFFEDKDEILKEIYKNTNKELGAARSKLPKASSANTMLLDRIYFQFKHIEDVVFVLKYYLHFRNNFIKLDNGYIPPKGYLHIKEVLEIGIKNGEFRINPSNIESESKVVAHAINGYLIEYYPNPPNNDELDEVIHSIHRFLIRSLKSKDLAMK